MTSPTKADVCSRPMTSVYLSAGGRSGRRVTTMTRKSGAALIATRSAANVSGCEYARATLVATQP